MVIGMGKAERESGKGKREGRGEIGPDRAACGVASIALSLAVHQLAKIS
jgi:hypothetical protein